MRGRRIVLACALLSLSLYGLLAWSGELRPRLPLYFTTHALLLLLMVVVWQALRRHRVRPEWILTAALLFRLVAALGPPALSDDVHRYVWDGRVQLHGVHPYRFAPDDPELEFLRDESWRSINHPQLRTIYPPLAQLWFLVLAATGAGPLGFQLAAGVLDFGVVLALRRLLRVLGAPERRMLLYAWNPLVVAETAGSAHVEPLGVGLVVLAASWILERRPARSAMALGAAIQAKLLPLVLLPLWMRHLATRHWLLLGLVLLAIAGPYLAHGPALGPGLADYAGRWEGNAPIYESLRSGLELLDSGRSLKPAIAAAQRTLEGLPIPWDAVYREVWPRRAARWILAGLALTWMIVVARRWGDDPARACLQALGGVLLLSPTMHPWYALWFLPFAAARASAAWLLLGALLPLSYAAEGGDVRWLLLVAQYLPPAALGVCSVLRRRSSRLSAAAPNRKGRLC